MHGAKRSQFVPNALGLRLAPIVTEAAGQIEKNPGVIASARRQRNSPAHALNAPLAARNGAFPLAPTSHAGKDDVREFGCAGIKEILDHQEFQSAQKLERAMTIGFRIRGIFSENV